MLLELSGVRAGYGVVLVLFGLDLKVHEGSVVAVLGRNGAGKTTLLRTIAGAIQPQTGHIHFDGVALDGMPVHVRARSGIAYVPQGREIFPSLTVIDNLKAAAFGVGRRDWRDGIDAMFAEFPVLLQKQAERGGSLSGGQQQILALARALITRPKLLLLDEPSEGIQPSIVDQIAAAVLEINRRDGITVVVVEQNLDFVARMNADCHVMDKGRIVFSCKAEEIAESEEMQKEYLGV